MSFQLERRSNTNGIVILDSDSCCLARKLRRDAEFIHALNHHAEIMTQHLAQCFVNLRGVCPAPQPLAKLRLDHVESSFDVGPCFASLEAGLTSARNTRQPLHDRILYQRSRPFDCDDMLASSVANFVVRTGATRRLRIGIHFVFAASGLRRNDPHVAFTFEFRRANMTSEAKPLSRYLGLLFQDRSVLWLGLNPKVFTLH